MYKVYRYLAKLFIFWLLFYFCNRIVFLMVQYNELRDLSFREIIRCFYFALPLDSSAVCYSVAFSFIILWIAFLTGKRYWLKVMQVLVVGLIFIQCAIVFGSAALYTVWHTRLDWKALAHFSHPAEPFRSSPVSLTILFFSTTIIFGLTYTFIYNHYIHLRKVSFPRLKKRLLPGLLLFPVVGFVIFSGIRGGWNRFPISLSVAYYSQHAVLNDASVNPSWSLIHDTRQVALDVNENPYHWMPQHEAERIVDSLYTFPKDTVTPVLTTTRPNIMLFILESWPGAVINAPTPPEVMPEFHKMIKNGIYFDSCYATGYVSDEGIPGILSAFPTSGNVSILTIPQKTINLPAINQVMDSVGYQSGFIYGGALNFGNIKSYVFNKHFNVVRTDRDFPAGLHRGALGIPDGVMAPFVADVINRAKEPFFYCWYTLSTHPPYDIPVPKWMDYGGKQQAFINTMHYADSSLGLFFKKIKNEPWYKNTLFVFVSDHSHDSQYDYPKEHRDRNAIPLLLYGDVIKPEWKGKIIHRITSQLDIAATLLGQMQLPHDAFPWSKNAFNPDAPQFAAINYLTGSGFITPEGYVSLEDQYPRFLLTNIKDSIMINKLKRLNRAYEQHAYDYFLKW